MNRKIINLERELELLYMQTKYDSLPATISKVLKDESIDDKTKIERIEVYIEVYFDNLTYSEDDYI